MSSGRLSPNGEAVENAEEAVENATRKELEEEYMESLREQARLLQQVKQGDLLALEKLDDMSLIELAGTGYNLVQGFENLEHLKAQTEAQEDATREKEDDRKPPAQRRRQESPTRQVSQADKGGDHTGRDDESSAGASTA